MVRAASIAIGSTLLSALAGCIEWDEQEIRFAYRAEHDRLDVQLVYRGLHYGDETGLFGPSRPDVERVGALLDRLREGRPMFALLTSWPFGFDLVELREAAGGAEEADPALEALLGHLAVDHGDFFRDPAGRLCFWQHLHVERLDEFLKVASTIVARELAHAEARADLRDAFRLTERDADARLLRWVKRGGPWLERRGGALTLRVPAGDADARQLSSRIGRLVERPRVAVPRDETATPEVERRIEEDAGDEELARRFGALELAAERTDEGVVLVLGDPGRELQLVRFDASDDGPRHDLAPLLAKRGVAIRDDLDDEWLRSEFAAFRRK